MHAQPRGEPAGWWSIPVLALGPLVTVAILYARVGTWFDGRQVVIAAAVALVFWSPLPFAVPALVLQDVRDRIRPDLVGVRAVARAWWVPVGLWRAGGTVRLQWVTSLVGLLVAGVFVATRG